MQAKTLIFSFVSISLLSAGCSDPIAQPATSASGEAGEAARHVMESSRHSNYVTPEKAALNDPVEAKEVASTTPSPKPYHIAVCLAGVDKDLDAALSAGINDEAQKRKVTVDIVSAGGDASKQAIELADLQKSKPNALIVAPVEAGSLGTQVASLNSAKIPVICMGQKITGAASEVFSNEAKAGEGAMVDIWGGILKNLKGTIGIVGFNADPIQKERIDGFVGMQRHVRNVKATFDGAVAQNTSDAAKKKAAEILRDHPDVSVFFVADDNLAAGVLKAITTAKSGARLVSIGADDFARQQVKIGQPWFAEIIEYPHLVGITSLDAAVTSLQGGKLPAAIVIPVATIVSASFK
ncbi:MAG TPA: substrate-binding domain-containing protein [Fimbriimonadaceae bacterium]|jgi:ABC-type sugar transport system substrate-binding protein